ncbi:hypothetical protein MXB_1042 [Myxobolus squamalis]|nr:hypothetical protein MXB_1042 [Myxobolus squamalis]
MNVSGSNYYEKFIFWNIGPMKRSYYFIFCMCNVLLFHVLAGIIQEFIYTSDNMRGHGFFVSSIFLFFTFLFSLVELFLSQKLNLSKINGSLSSLSLLGLLMAGSVGLSNYSFRYLNFTAQVMFKCCKPVFVLVGSCHLNKRVFTHRKIISCLVITCGIVWFSVADAKSSPTFHPLGLIIIFLALTIDAISPNVHERILKNHNLNILETIMAPSLVSSLLLMFFEILTLDIIPASNKFSIKAGKLLSLIFIHSGLCYIGAYYVVSIIKHFGALESSLGLMVFSGLFLEYIDLFNKKLIYLSKSHYKSVNENEIIESV